MDEKEVDPQNNTLAIEIPNNNSLETNDDIFVKSEKHRKSIDQILVSQYMDDEEYGSDDYVVTYSFEDKSVLGWSVNIEKNGPQRPDVYFKVADLLYWGKLQTLSKKILLLHGYRNNCRYLF
jgi:hypothetical protein